MFFFFLFALCFSNCYIENDEIFDKILISLKNYTFVSVLSVFFLTQWLFH